MLRFKYKLYNGDQPHEVITSVVPSINAETDLFLGQFVTGTWYYGEIDTDESNQDELESVLGEWEAQFINDQAALGFANSFIPQGEKIYPWLTAKTAEIKNSKVVKEHDVDTELSFEFCGVQIET